MGVHIKCPQCGEELKHDDKIYRLDKAFGDRSILSCTKCEWIGIVSLGVEFEKLEKTEFNGLEKLHFKGTKNKE